jgi:hypothetical protein
MKSSVTKAFRQKLDELPASVQEQAAKAYSVWRSDPYHNSLQFKRVSPRQPIYSVRVSLDYRSLKPSSSKEPRSALRETARFAKRSPYGNRASSSSSVISVPFVVQ